MFLQAFELEECFFEGDLCRYDFDVPLASTACLQKYSTYRLYAITEEDKQVYDITEEDKQVYDSFSFPSSCLCHHSSLSFRSVRSHLNHNSLQPTCPGRGTALLERVERRDRRSTESACLGTAGTAIGSTARRASPIPLQRS